MNRRKFLKTFAAAGAACAVLPRACPAEAGKDDPLAPWKAGVKVRPVAPDQNRHSIHTYYVTTPESPDGRSVLYYTSGTPEGYVGDLRVLDRAGGRETVIARNVTVEDAHRAACQQWSSGGRRAVFHDVRDGTWLVACIDIASGQERVLAKGRQTGFGQGSGHIVPIYGPHWKPEDHRDLELVNVETGEIKTAVTAAAVKARYPAEIAKAFGDRPVSIFFPVLSPDGKRVFFKMATPAGGDFRSSSASVRQMLICYDLEKSQLILARATWGHPAWHPDSRHILEVGPTLFDSDTGSGNRIPGLPGFKGSHPSVSPDGRLFVTDASLETSGGAPKEWGIAVGLMAGGDHVMVHRFDHSRGAKSWRRNDPHPAFSPDGKRIYFNVGATEWTSLHVAEAAPPAT